MGEPRKPAWYKRPALTNMVLLTDIKTTPNSRAKSITSCGGRFPRTKTMHFKSGSISAVQNDMGIGQAR